MTIPTFDVVMPRVLRLCAEHPWAKRDLVTQIADDFGLSEEERSALIPSGGSTTIANRVGWAATHLVQAGLLKRPERGVVQITRRGHEALTQNPDKIDVAFLDQFPEYRAFRHRTKHPPSLMVVPNGSAVLDADPSGTPDEQIHMASSALEESLREDLLARVIEMPPAFFERLIIDLLVKMGYGGSRSDAGEHLGKTGDGGVDGLIREDQLGLDRIYLQAKRYQPGNTVGSETVQAFIGALYNKGAAKGVLITTSTFSRTAIEAANQPGSFHIVLIDGSELAKFMVRFNVGVRVAETVEIKRIDQDYFVPADPE